MYKLGKTPARLDAVKFKLATYLTTLPKVPSKFGHWPLVTTPWGMLGNDQYGDCVWAGAGHETMLWDSEAGKKAGIDTPEMLLAYHDVTGFNANDPSTDNGTDMQAAASYRRKTGILDTDSSRHKVAAYLAISPGNSTEMKQAIYLFSAVGIGFQFPDYAMDQFNKGQTWHVRKGGQIVGGHYVPAVGYDSSYVYVVTWGKLQRMSWGFFRAYNDENVAYVSEEMLTGGKSLEGFDSATLQADLGQLK